MLKVVIDTNVFLSGILFGGNPRKILFHLLQKDFILCISPALKAEIINKLLFKFQASDTFLNSLSKLIDNYSEKYIPKHHLNICKDKEDNFLFELAEAANADLIVSGDRKVLEIKEYKGIKVISPKHFLKLLEED